VKARKDVEIAKISLSQSRRRRFGQTTLSLSYGFQGVGADFDESRREFSHNRWSGALSVGLSLPEPGLGSEIELARATLKARESAYEKALAVADEQQGLLIKQVASLSAGIDLETRRVRLLEDLLEIRRKQFDQAVIPRRDLVESEIDLLNARISLFQTMRKLNMVWVDLILGRGENPIEILGVKG
jgi:outer membrane protein TolC